MARLGSSGNVNLSRSTINDNSGGLPITAAPDDKGQFYVHDGKLYLIRDSGYGDMLRIYPDVLFGSGSVPSAERSGDLAVVDDQYAYISPNGADWIRIDGQNVPDITASNAATDMLVGDGSGGWSALNLADSGYVAMSDGSGIVPTTLRAVGGDINASNAQTNLLKGDGSINWEVLDLPGSGDIAVSNGSDLSTINVQHPTAGTNVLIANHPTGWQLLNLPNSGDVPMSDGSQVIAQASSSFGGNGAKIAIARRGTFGGWSAVYDPESWVDGVNDEFDIPSLTSDSLYRVHLYAIDYDLNLTDTWYRFTLTTSGSFESPSTNGLAARNFYPVTGIKIGTIDPEFVWYIFGNSSGSGSTSISESIIAGSGQIDGYYIVLEQIVP